MRRYISNILALGLLAAVSISLSPRAHAQLVTDPFRHGFESAAYQDGPASLLFNPAAIGMRYPSELAFTWVDARFGDEAWRGLLAREQMSFAASGEMNGRPSWSFAFSTGNDPLRLGSDVTWIPKPGSGRATDFRLGLLARPEPYMSWGFVADHVSEPVIGGVRLDREYTAGIGWRPLAHDRKRAHTLGTKVTLTADLRFLEKWSRSQYQPRFGAEIDLAQGISVRGIYVPKERGFQVSVSLLGVKAGYHGQAGFDRDTELQYSTHTLSLHEGEDRTILMPGSQRRVGHVVVGGRLGDDRLSGFSIYGPSSVRPVASLHRRLQQALEDPLTKGVLLDLRGTSNMGQIEELRPRIQALREAGKPVVAYLEYGGRRGDLYLASACDKIVTSPEAFYAGLGLRAERRYYNKLLADWGVRMDRTSYGKYKSAYRNYSVDSIPAPDREALEHNLDVIQDLFVSQVAADRGMPRDRLLPLIDGRAWPSHELQKAGLVDEVGYREDAFATLGALTGLGKKPRTSRLARKQVTRRAWTYPSRIAVVYATGAIEAGRSGNDLLMGPYMGSETVSAQIRSAFRNPKSEAVVLRIESPGGSGLASNLIYHEALRMKRETGKPLIVSMGGVAASGGYEIAAPGDRIFANRFTYTGSIGVVTVKPSFQGWYAKHGVRQQFFDRGRYQRGWSYAEDWDDELQATADSAIFDSYRDFVAQVAEQRERSWDEIDEVAQGRVWLGDDALTHGLVDEIGGLDEAIAEARRRAEIPEGEKISLLEYRRPRPSFVQRLVGTWLNQAVEDFAHMPAPGAPLLWMPDDEAP